MSRINVRVDEDLLEKVDAQGEVRSEVVREALKNYVDEEPVLDDEGVKQPPQELAQVVEDIVNQKIQEDIYPRFGKIYDKLDEEMEEEEESKVPIELTVNLSPEVYNFYEKYTRAFETPVSDIVSNLLEEEALRLSDQINQMPHKSPSWALETEEEEAENE
ncbi:MAG: ribbon-helix-helix domain-containing protein [Halobacteria archaeon]|nr:ribbon-helix-helix domain-containing protein [Halobacteria archaeon]